RLVGYASIVLACCAFWLSPARADGVVYRVRGCGEYLFATTQTGDAVLAGNISSAVKERDELRGNIERLGVATLFGPPAETSVSANVQEVRLDKAEADRRIAIHCRVPWAERIVSGSVSRVCGNTIFVDTVNGYAVLERLAGGVVAVNDELSGNFDRPGNAS